MYPCGRRVEIVVVRLAVFGIHLSGNLRKLILVTNVLEYDQVLGIKRVFCTAATLMRGEYDAAVPVKTALPK
jgi:hypothetical protein